MAPDALGPGALGPGPTIDKVTGPKPDSGFSICIRLTGFGEIGFTKTKTKLLKKKLFFGGKKWVQGEKKREKGGKNDLVKVTLRFAMVLI